MESQIPLIVIVGPTASGKSSLALQIAEKYSGEIICSDSRTVYKGMDIGTAKPSVEDQARVPHWGLDLVEPGERFTAADFQSYARQKIQEIRARQHVPILVGGTGLYIDGIIFNFEFKKTLSEKQREKYEEWTIGQLQDYLKRNDIPLPENYKNKRHLIRRIEIGDANNQRDITPIDNTIIVGITTKNESLKSRIRGRTEQIFENGVVGEAKRLGKKYGWDNAAMSGNVYKVIRDYVNGELTQDEMKEKNNIADWQLAKRQMTWFRRNRFIQWLTLQEAQDFLESYLADFSHS